MPDGLIHRQRERNGSQEKLAEAAALHRTYTWLGIEGALRNPSLENLVKLANALDITLAELFSAKAVALAQVGARKHRD
jgi:transcriptional regulator with XRE-family HTH domain